MPFFKKTFAAVSAVHLITEIVFEIFCLNCMMICLIFVFCVIFVCFCYAALCIFVYFGNRLNPTVSVAFTSFYR